MFSKKVVTLLVIAGVGMINACENNPVSTGSDDPSFAVAVAGDDTGPFLLELGVVPDPALLGCAQAINNEGMISGWNVIDIGSGHTVEIAAFWNRTGEFVRYGPAGDDELRVLGMGDRGQILDMDGDGYPGLHVYNPDGSVLDLTTGWGRWVDIWNAVRMNRRGDVMATYRVDPEYCRSVGCPVEDIMTTHLGWLAAPGRRPWDDYGVCVGETIDHDGAVYGRCWGDGPNRHYRWTARDNARQFPSGTDRLLDVWIDHINRYGELVGRTISGPIFWSPATGRIPIPMPPGVSRLVPVGINDRGDVLLSSDYMAGENMPAGTIAFWTRTGGTKVLPRKSWSSAQVHDIDNKGVIVGCVGGAAGDDPVPAYWRIH